MLKLISYSLTIINIIFIVYFKWCEYKLKKENKILKQHIQSMQIILDVQIERIKNENI